MSTLFRLAIAALALVLTSGCATVMTGESQTLTITAQGENGEPIQQAQCSLRNDKGSWTAQAPGTVQVRRSADDLTVQCTKEGQPDGLARGISRVGGAIFGNILIGGGIGAVIDHAKGTAYHYPDEVPVQMGRSIVVDRRKDESQAAAGGSADTAVRKATTPESSAADGPAKNF